MSVHLHKGDVSVAGFPVIVGTGAGTKHPKLEPEAVVLHPDGTVFFAANTDAQPQAVTQVKFDHTSAQTVFVPPSDTADTAVLGAIGADGTPKWLKVVTDGASGKGNPGVLKLAGAVALPGGATLVGGRFNKTLAYQGADLKTCTAAGSCAVFCRSARVARRLSR